MLLEREAELDALSELFEAAGQGGDSGPARSLLRRLVPATAAA